MNTISELETILADVETQLWRHRSEQLEAVLDGVEQESTPSVDEQSEVASQGLKQDHKSSGGGLPAPAPEGYRGYSLEREGDIRFDDGSIDSAQAERMDSLRWALQGGPNAPLPATQAGKAAKAKQYSRKDRHNMGDVDNSGPMSGAS